MKLVTLFVAGVLGLGGAACGSKQQAEAPKPVEAAQTSTDKAAKPEAAPTNTVAKNEAAPAGHESCGDHKMAEGGAGEANCPFEDERKAAAAEPAHEGCGDHAPAGSAEAAEPMPGKGPAAGQAQHLGSAFTIADAKPLAEAVKAAPTDKEELVRIAGTVDKVCQKRGCWMVVRDGDVEARVIMKDHAFAIPFDSAGQKAVVEGTLKVKVFTEAQAKHLAEDGKEDPSKVTGETKEFLLTATGVQLGG